MSLAQRAPVRAGLSDAQFALIIIGAILLIHVVVIIVPLIYSFWISLHETNVILRKEEFVGFAKWGEVLEDTERLPVRARLSR